MDIYGEPIPSTRKEQIRASEQLCDDFERAVFGLTDAQLDTT
jgi:hypothetical protein